MQDWTGKVVLVSGASGAVGQACCDLLLSAGASLAMTDISECPARFVGAERVRYKRLDSTDRGAVLHAFQRFLEDFGRIDAVVLGAGVEGPVAEIESISEADLDRVLAVNVKAALFWLQACLPPMKRARRGAIVALASISGVVGGVNLGAYVLSKHAIVGLVRSAALEAAAFDVRVNAVCPGPIMSPMMERIESAMAANNPAHVSNRGGVANSLPLRRYVTVEEVAKMIAFLISEDSSSCTGGAFMIDGGFTAR